MTPDSRYGADRRRPARARCHRSRLGRPGGRAPRRTGTAGWSRRGRASARRGAHPPIRSRRSPRCSGDRPTSMSASVDPPGPPCQETAVPGRSGRSPGSPPPLDTSVPGAVAGVLLEHLRQKGIAMSTISPTAGRTRPASPSVERSPRVSPGRSSSAWRWPPARPSTSTPTERRRGLVRVERALVLRRLPAGRGRAGGVAGPAGAGGYAAAARPDRARPGPRSRRDRHRLLDRLAARARGGGHRARPGAPPPGRVVRARCHRGHQPRVPRAARQRLDLRHRLNPTDKEMS